MGQVYRARDPRLERDIALKVLPETGRPPSAVSRFPREARAIAALNHPNIVTIHSVEEVDGVPFLTMELVEGAPLDRADPRGRAARSTSCSRSPSRSPRRSPRRTHAASSIATSSRPTSWSARDGRVKVLDFGLAKNIRASTPSCRASTATRDAAGASARSPTCRPSS